MIGFQIIYPTCDKYLHLLKGNVFLVEKFWPEHPQIHVIGFKKPDFDLPANWTFYSMGEDKGKTSWSNTLIEWFNKYGSVIGDYFMHMNDDAPPLRNVKHEMIKYIFDLMKNDNKIGKVNLSGAHGYESDFLDGHIRQKKNTNKTIKIPNLKYDIGILKNGVHPKIGLANDIWKKEYFFKYLKPNLSSWNWEERKVSDDHKVITTLEIPPIAFCHVYRQSGYLFSKWYRSGCTNEKLSDELQEKYIELTGLDKIKKIWK